MLDEGATGSVFLAKWDSNQVAVKVITNVGEKEGLEETVLGIMLIHPNVRRGRRQCVSACKQLRESFV